jgi:hypothetical protein
MEHLSKDWLQYCTAVGSIVAFCVAIWKYLDARRRDLESRRFEQFHRVFAWVAGRTPEGNVLVDTQQAVAVYELSEFREYRDLILPIVGYYLAKTTGEPDDSLFRAALRFTASRLKNGS